MPETKKRVAILGGGAGSMTTAYYLSRTPALREQYEVTVYQLGWRLGGKGASGRGPWSRIEEHGLHVFWGFYDNAFRMMREAYEALSRPASMPLADFEHAFIPHDLVVSENYFQGDWHALAIDFPRNSTKPGTAPVGNTPWNYVEEALDLILKVFIHWRPDEDVAPPPPPEEEDDGWIAHLIRKVEGVVDELEDAFVSVIEGATNLVGGALLSVALEAARQALVPGSPSAQIEEMVLGLLRRFLDWLWVLAKPAIEADYEIYLFFTTMDFLVSNLIGLISDRVLFKGFNSIDQLDYREWLGEHGAHPQTLKCSATRAIYDAAMCLVKGDPDQQLIGAGSALRALMRIGLTYKGAVLYKFAAGMGDTIFTPLYEACRANGVRFEFFHKVEEVIGEEAADGTRAVTKLRIGRQVTLADPTSEYQPLIPVKNLACWPSEPLYDQIVEGEQLVTEDINLESFYTPWESVEERVLERGVDFDEVVFGIPVGSVRYLCPTLMALDPRWKTMADEVATVQTQAFQLWLSRSTQEMGWRHGNPILSTFVEPVDTWGDLTDLVGVEGWTPPAQPASIAYFCGAMASPTYAPPPDRHDYPASQHAIVKRNALRMLEENLGTLWPDATQPTRPGVFDWTLLYPPTEGSGPARFDNQYWRANVDPNERYTLALPGDSERRIKAGETGFENLFITGDWIDNGFYVGSIEGTVMAGLQAFHALTGLSSPEIIGADWNY